LSFLYSTYSNMGRPQRARTAPREFWKSGPAAAAAAAVHDRSGSPQPTAHTAAAAAAIRARTHHAAQRRKAQEAQHSQQPQRLYLQPLSLSNPHPLPRLPPTPDKAGAPFPGAAGSSGGGHAG
jgi:hypothetical protein